MKRIFLILLFGIMMINAASAWSTNQFNNSATTEQFPVNTSYNVTRWLAVPSGSLVIHATFNLSGFNTLIEDSQAYFHFDESSGSAIDSAWGNNGTLSGAGVTQGNAGIQGLAYAFNGVAGKVNVSNKRVNITNPPISINAWINWSGNTGVDEGIIGAADGNGWGLYFKTADNKLSWGKFGVDEVSADYQPTQNKWDMITLVYNTTDLIFYTNGTTVSQVIHYSTGNWANQDYNIGMAGSSGTGYFKGLIDEIGVWNRVLTPLEISQLYNGGKGLLPSNLNITVGNIASVESISVNATTAKTITTPNLASSVNNYLGTCIPIAGFCNVPFVFSSAVNGTVNWSALNADNNGFIENSQIANTTTYETALEYFAINITYDSSMSASAILHYNGTSYGGTQVGTGNTVLFTKYLDIPLLSVPSEARNYTWEIIIGGSSSNSTTNTQTVNPSILTLCNSTINVPYVNFTFKNETVAQESINALISTATFQYWLGSGSVIKNLSFLNASENPSYAFCFSPQNKALHTTYSVGYSNANSQQRVYAPGTETFTNITTNKTLWLLPTSDGIFVTFQVLTSGRQPISNAVLKMSRAGYGDIATSTTGASGTVSIFLNPSYIYTLNVTAAGFPGYQATQAFTITEFTIILGEQTTSQGTDFYRGINIDINPKGGVLENATWVNFTFNIHSSVQSLDNYGFTIRNQTTILGGNSSTTAYGSTLSLQLNTANQTFLIMDYFWTINGTTTNGTTTFSVKDYPQGSIFGFFVRLRAYLVTAPGLLGLDSFGLAIISFTIILLFTGVVSYKYGLTSAKQIATAVAFAVIFLDIVGIMPNPIGLPYFPSVFVVLVTLTLWLGEAW